MRKESRIKRLKTTKRSLVFAILVIALAIAAVVAQGATNVDPEGFFKSLDKDADGDLDADELRRVIRETGVEQYDEHHEVEVGVQTALSLDKDNDKALLHKDLVSQWVTLASLMTPETVGEWLTHAVGLSSETAQLFVHANWTGLDLPRLLNRNVDSILSGIKVDLSRAEKIKLVGAVKLRMLNVGRVPHAPELKVLDSSKSARCGVIMLSWSNPSRSFPDIHKYRVFRRIARDDDLPEHPWALVFEGHTTAFTDRVKDVGPQFDYKIEAWNLVGHSIPTELHDVVPSKRGCDSSSWSVIWNFLADFQTYSVNLIGLVTFAFFILKQARSPPENVGGVNMRKERSFRTNSVEALSAPPAQSSGAIPPPLAVGVSFYQRKSDSSLVVESEDESNGGSTRLPELQTELISPIHRFATQQTFREYSPDKCVECGKPVTRNTRHQCGMCMHVFCTRHTAIHPHMETKLPFVGTVVLSTCGINSKCRCYPCAGLPRLNSSQSSANGTGPPRSASPTIKDKETKGKKLWKSVKKDMLLKKSVKTWQRKSDEDVQVPLSDTSSILVQEPSAAATAAVETPDSASPKSPTKS